MRYISIVFLNILFVTAYCQQNFIKGSISQYPTDVISYVQLQAFESNSYQKKGISIVNKEGNFSISTEISTNCIGRLCFNSGDTIMCVLGEDQIEFSAKWQYGRIANHMFKNSAENEAFELVKNEMRRLKKQEDSIGYLGIELHEFDPQYISKSNSLKYNHQLLKVDFNAHLESIRLRYPDTYTSKSIIPIVKIANMVDLKSFADKFDNNRSFQHYHFFDFIQTNDLNITNNPFLEKKILEYMDLWVSQREKGLKEGVDIVMQKFSDNEMASKYALEKLIIYFTERNNFPLLDYINSKHMTTCDAPNLTGKSAEVMEQMKRLSKGNTAPEIVMYDEKENRFQLSQKTKKGKTVLFFWASWCPHCTEMMPKIVEFYNLKKKDNIDVIAISLDNNKTEWLSFIESNKLTWINISDLKKWESPVVKDYALRGTPTFYVIDNSMKIIGRTNDFDELKSLVQ